jgi:TRAP-type C4-dicarboxylate transport system substrate-binding protein
MTIRLRTPSRAAGFLTITLLLAACSDATEGSGTGDASNVSVQPDKAGNSDESGPRTLVLATVSSPERPRGAVAARFAEELSTSDGDLAVEVHYGASDPVADFTSGAADMLLVPTLQLDTMGVDSFRALSMPLIIDDDEQADRVAADPVVARMLGGLDAIDATGLLFAPVAGIHLALQGEEPLRSIDQLAGGVRAVPQGDLTDAVYRAMGTTAVHDLNDDAWDAAVQNGDVVAKEFPTALVGVGPLPVVMATNFTLYYDFVVLLIRNDVLADLTTEQVDTLRAAAASAQQRSIDERSSEDDAFRDECSKGADLSAAPVTLWAQTGRAVDDLLLGELEDPATRETYDAIKRAAGQRSVSWPNECRNGEVVPYEPPTDPDAVLADGTYRVDGRTVDQLLVSGVSPDTANPGNEVDYWDFAVADGVATLTAHYPDGRVTAAESDYSVNDGLVTFQPKPGSDGFGGRFALSITAEGFRLEPLRTDDVAELNISYDVAGLGLFEFTEVG